MSFSKPRIVLLAAASATLLMQAPAALAFNFGDVMSPGRWMGGNRDYEDYYDNRDYIPYGPPPGAYGFPPYGAPYGAYGAPPYGAPATWAPAATPAPSQMTAQPPAVPAATAPATSNAKSNEIDTLKRRIEELEARQAPVSTYAPPATSADRGTKPNPARGLSSPTAPASSLNFRPIDKN